MSSGVGALVPADDPLMIAWKAYQATEGYANTLRWAIGKRDVEEPVPDDPTYAERRRTHVEGSLWAAFVEGFEACKNTSAELPGTDDGS